MRLTPWEEERLLIFSAAELARRHRDRGLLLNAPEATALICDAMLEAARGGSSYADVEAAGRAAVAPTEVMPGIRAIVDQVRLEVLLDDGVRLIVLVDPIGGAEEGDGEEGEDGGFGDMPGLGGGMPGAIRPADDAPPVAPDARETISLTVRSESTRVVRVTSRYPFERVNRRLVFDREAARGFRLDLPAGATERWSPGETRTVRLVRYGGDG